MFVENNNKNRNSAAKIKANNKYSLSHYKNISVKIKPQDADFIRETAKQNKISLAQLIIDAVTEYNINHTDNTAESTEDTAEQIPEYIKNMLDRSKAYDKDFSEKQKIKRKVERERAKAEYNLID